MGTNSGQFVNYNSNSAYSSSLCNVNTVVNFESGYMPLRFTDWYSKQIEENYRIIYLSNIGSTKYIPKKPFVLMASRVEDEVKIEYTPLGLHAFGETEEEALDEIKEDIIDLCESVLLKEDIELGFYPRNWKRILEEFVYVKNS